MYYFVLLLLGFFDAEGASDPIGPTPDVTSTDRRRVAALVKRGGVGRLRKGR